MQARLTFTAQNNPRDAKSGAFINKMGQQLGIHKGRPTGSHDINTHKRTVPQAHGALRVADTGDIECYRAWSAQNEPSTHNPSHNPHAGQYELLHALAAP